MQKIPFGPRTNGPLVGLGDPSRRHLDGKVAYAYEGNLSVDREARHPHPISCLSCADPGGWPTFQRGWPAAVFLVFMLPLPHAAHYMIPLRLQRIVTLGSVFVMQLTGLKDSRRHESMITLHDHANTLKTLEVTQRSYGLSMLTTLTATVTAMIMLFPLAHWKRFVVLASTLPISLACSIALIVAKGWSYYCIDGVRGDENPPMSGHLLYADDAARLDPGGALRCSFCPWLADDRGLSIRGASTGLSFLVAPRRPTAR